MALIGGSMPSGIILLQLQYRRVGVLVLNTHKDSHRIS